MNNFFKKYYPYIVAVLLVLMFALEISSAIQESQTIDEGVHLSAGYSYWEKRDFRMNPEHPPLIKLIAALPLLPLHLKSPFNYQSWSQPDEWQFARDFIYDNYISADTILLLGRIPMMLLSLLLGFFIFFWAKKLFGVMPAIFSLTLYIFYPNIIAHSRYVTTDVGVTLFFLMSIYFFGRYLSKPSSGRLIVAGIIFGLAQVSKFSAVILLPIFIILYIIKWWNSNRNLNLKIFFKTFGVILLITAAIIWLIYGFEVKKPINDYKVQELYQTQEKIIGSGSLAKQPTGLQKIINITDLSKKSGQFIRRFIDNAPIPAYTYFKGIIQLESHNAGGHTAYLMGHYSNFGWWYYFPVAFLVKTPMATLILLIIFLVVIIYYVIYGYLNKQVEAKLFIIKFFKKIILLLKNINFNYYLIFIPPLALFTASLFFHLNLGLRYILPIYPFIFISLGYLVNIKLKQGDIIYKICLYSILIIYIFSSCLIYPHYLAYFSELVGGANNGPKYLVDSNIDWGQDAKNLKKYMVENHIDYVCLSYFGQAKLEYYKIDYRYLPDNENFKGINNLNCVVAISVTSLLSEAREYGWLLNYKPTTKIGYSIYIYDFRNK